MLFLSAPSLTRLPVLSTVADPQKTSSFLRDFPGGPVVKTQPSNAGVVGLIPGQGTEISMLWPKIKNKQIFKKKSFLNKFLNLFLLKYS